MASRRAFVQGAGWAALAAFTGIPAMAAAAPRWVPYRDTISIDALSGSELFYLPEGDPGVPAALQALRDSGMTAVMVAPAPQGRFWYSDAAFETTKREMEAWKAAVARHPDVLMLVREHADIGRARRAGKVGVIFTFQGTEPLGEDPDRTPMFRAMGLRVLQLTHNRRNLVGDGCMEPGTRA